MNQQTQIQKIKPTLSGLPQEIRDLICEYALRGPHIIDRLRGASLGIKCRCPYHIDSPLLFSTRDSRAFALKYYELRDGSEQTRDLQYVDFSQDLIWLWEHSFHRQGRVEQRKGFNHMVEEDYLAHLRMPIADLARITHLDIVIGQPQGRFHEVTNWFDTCWRHFPRLKEISFLVVDRNLPDGSSWSADEEYEKSDRAEDFSCEEEAAQNLRCMRV